jgi:hypothetical protein
VQVEESKFKVLKSRCVQILVPKSGVFQRGCFVYILVAIFRWSKPPHNVKVNPLGEEADPLVQSTGLG